MKNVEVEIYLNQFITFFDNNPNDLIDLIGDVLKETFYEKVREQSYKNFEEGNDVSLTNSQLINIVVELKKVDEIKPELIDKVFEYTNFGLICLN
jgi:hypothetical protein